MKFRNQKYSQIAARWAPHPPPPWGVPGWAAVWGGGGGGGGTAPFHPQLNILNIFDVRPLIMLQMYRVIPQDYAGPTKND